MKRSVGNESIEDPGDECCNIYEYYNRSLLAEKDVATLDRYQRKLAC